MNNWIACSSRDDGTTHVVSPVTPIDPRLVASRLTPGRHPAAQRPAWRSIQHAHSCPTPLACGSCRWHALRVSNAEPPGRSIVTQSMGRGGGHHAPGSAIGASRRNIATIAKFRRGRDLTARRSSHRLAAQRHQPVVRQDLLQTSLDLCVTAYKSGNWPKAGSVNVDRRPQQVENSLRRSR